MPDSYSVQYTVSSMPAVHRIQYKLHRIQYKVCLQATAELLSRLLLARLQVRPCVMLIDDAQWMHPSSWDLLARSNSLVYTV